MIHQLLALYSQRLSFFTELTLEHIVLSGLAILIAAVIGLSLGVLIAQIPSLSPWVLGINNLIYTIPAIALLGGLIPFFGIGNTTAVIALSVYAVLPMVRNTYSGIRQIPPQIIEAAEGMGSTPAQILWKVQLPLALPIIMAGFRTMTVMTIALCGIASFIGAGGLGIAIYRGITTNNQVMTLAGSILIAALAISVDALLGILERKIRRKING